MNRVTLLLVLVIIVIVVYAINNPVPQPAKHPSDDQSGDHSGDHSGDQPGLPSNSPPPNSPPASPPPNIPPASPPPNKPQPSLPPEQPTDMNRPGPSKPSNGNTIGDGTLPPTLPAQSTGSAPPVPLPPTLPAQSTGSAPPKQIKPRVKSLGHCGNINSTRGWYDVQNQGVRNDYCAYMWFGIYGCALAGSTGSELTPIVHNEMRMTDPHDPYITGQINGCP